MKGSCSAAKGHTAYTVMTQQHPLEQKDGRHSLLSLYLNPYRGCVMYKLMSTVNQFLHVLFLVSVVTDCCLT